MITSKDKKALEKLLHKEAIAGEVDTCAALLHVGVDVDAEDSEGLTALYWAAFNGRVETCKLLLMHDADVNHKPNTGDSTPLHSAALRGRTEVCKLLMAYGADPCDKADGGVTPIDLARRRGHDELADLCEMSAKYNKRKHQ